MSVNQLKIPTFPLIVFYLLNFCLISLLFFSSKLSSLPLIHSSFIIPKVLFTSIISLQIIEYLFLSNSRISFPYLMDRKYFPVESNHHQKLTCLPLSFLIDVSPLSKQIILYCNCLLICFKKVILLLTTLSSKLGFLLGVKFNDFITFVVMSISKVNNLYLNSDIPFTYNNNQQLNNFTNNHPLKCGFSHTNTCNVNIKTESKSMSNFDLMKKNTKDVFNKLTIESLKYKEGKDGRHTKTSKSLSIKLLKELFGEKGKELGNRIENCDDGNYCSSVYCIRCSKRLSHRMYKRWLQEYSKGFKLYSTTILDGLCLRNEEGIKDWLKQFRSKIELCRKYNNNFYIDGWIEIEIIDTWKLGIVVTDDELVERKIKYLKTCLKEMDVTGERYYLLPHFHGIVRGLNMKTYREIFKRYFTRVREIELKEVGFKNQSVEVGLKTWGNYIMKISTPEKSYRKDLYTFKTTFKSENNYIDDYINDDNSYRIPEVVISEMMLLHDIVKGKNNKGLIIRSGK